MDGDEFRSYRGKTFTQRPFFPVYALLGISYLLVVIGLAVALSKDSIVTDHLSLLLKGVVKSRSIHLLKKIIDGKRTCAHSPSLSNHRSQMVCFCWISYRISYRLEPEMKGIGSDSMTNTQKENGNGWMAVTIEQVSRKNWKTGEPNTYLGRDEDCGQLWINGEWNDYTCSSNSYYVCEKPLPSKPTTAPKRT
ncbi:hypothetical protein JD844_010655 [Phrynosoma platyrhinos]|uniref:C-type lectin domain-containing protein n=1 Tax=Phrynosoma platyrhinos TaxID=52577 RepID=A0ABQ7TH62_PHRPL|nr:hypothetical protein JD844_010655 [Phrynosoma platyrhinos]